MIVAAEMLQQVLAVTAVVVTQQGAWVLVVQVVVLDKEAAKAMPRLRGI